MEVGCKEGQRRRARPPLVAWDTCCADHWSPSLLRSRKAWDGRERVLSVCVFRLRVWGAKEMTIVYLKPEREPLRLDI